MHIFDNPLFYLGAIALIAFLLIARGIASTVAFIKERRALARPKQEFRQGDLAAASVEIAEQAREAILWARSPERSPAEGNDRPASQQPEDVPIKARRNKIYAAISRLKKNQVVFQKLVQIQEEVKQEFGAQAALPLGVISNAKNLVIGATESLLQLDMAVHGNMLKELDKRRPLEVTSGLRLPEDGIDPIKQQLDEALIPLRALYKSLHS